ncbi:MAG: YraN family protein [Clostridia bacterium]|nr:YraN family protein [Clostridia bacterium]
MTTKNIGDIGENAAAKYLKRHFFRIVERTYRFHRDEIDIIAKNRKFLVFVEVKTRSRNDVNDNDFGTPSSAVDAGKMSRTKKAAVGYLAEHPESKRAIRFDVIEVYLDKNSEKPKIIDINHIENAF